MATPAGSQDKKPTGYDKKREETKEVRGIRQATSMRDSKQKTIQLGQEGKKRTREPDPRINVTGPRRGLQETKGTRKRSRSSARWTGK